MILMNRWDLILSPDNLRGYKMEDLLEVDINDREGMIMRLREHFESRGVATLSYEDIIDDVIRKLKNKVIVPVKVEMSIPSNNQLSLF